MGLQSFDISHYIFAAIHFFMTWISPITGIFSFTLLYYTERSFLFSAFFRSYIIHFCFGFEIRVWWWQEWNVFNPTYWRVFVWFYILQFSCFLVIILVSWWHILLTWIMSISHKFGMFLWCSIFLLVDILVSWWHILPA